METQYLSRGENLSGGFEFKDADGLAVEIDETWGFGMRVCKGSIGGATAADVNLTLDAGVVAFDQSTDEFDPGDYFYDLKITDPDGRDEFCNLTKLTIEPTNTPYL